MYVIKFLRPLTALAAGLALALPSVALAHPKMVAATPAAGAPAKSAQRIVLTFSEKLTPRVSGATLVLVGSGGTETRVAGLESRIGEDGKSLVLVPARKLRAGAYRVDWHVVGADTHRITGKHTFRIG